MFTTTYRILIQAIRSANFELQSAIAAHGYYQKAPVTRTEKAYCWVQGLCAGVSQAMLEQRLRKPSQARFADDYPQEVRFSVHKAGRAVLLVEVLSEDSTGSPVSVLSTLNYAEAQTIYAGLATLRSTGVHGLSDRQACELLECTSQMLCKEAYFGCASSSPQLNIAN